MKKAYRNMALAAVILSASSILGCSNVQIPYAVKVQQVNANHDQYPYNDGEVLDYVGKSLRFLYKGIIINHYKNRANLH